MTATQAKTDDRRMGRRDLMRRTAIGAGAAVGVGASAGSVTADDDDDDSSVSDYLKAAWVATSPVAGAGAVAYGALFEDDTEDDLESAQEYEAHLNLYNRTQESRLQLDETLASLERDVQLVQNKAREEAIFRVWEAGVDDLDEQAAEDAAEDAIKDAFATVEKSILTSWTIRYERYASLIGTDLVPDGSRDVLATYSPHSNEYDDVGAVSSSNFNSHSYSLVSHQLVDGTTIDVPTDYGSGGSYSTLFSPIDEWVDADGEDSDYMHSRQLHVTVPDADDYSGVDEDPHDHSSPVPAIKSKPWNDIYHGLMDEYDDMMAEVSSMVDTYFSAAQDGEIDLSQMRGPAHLTNTAENAEDYEEAALALRAMGYKLAEQPCQVEVEFEGETLTLDARLARTMNNPNPLPVGEEIDPDINAGSIYAALNVEDEDGLRGETTELAEPFTIVDAGGASEVTFNSRQLAESDNDLDAEEIAEIFEENREADDEAREVVHEVAIDVGGGGISIPGVDGDVNLGIVAAVVAVGAYLLGR